MMAVGRATASRSRPSPSRWTWRGGRHRDGGRGSVPLPVRGRGPGVFEFVLAPSVAVLLDEGAGLPQFVLVAEHPGPVEVDVGQVQRHRAALRDLLGFIEVTAGVAVF